MRELALLLNEMVDGGVIRDYAVFGAVAQMRYTEAVATIDADILVAAPEPDRLDLLAGIYDYCRRRGLPAAGESVRVGAWPAQFVPVFSPLTVEALATAETANFEGVPLRVVRADYLAVIALSVGRAKDFARILALLESAAVDRTQIGELASRHGLAAAWARFERRFLDG